MAIKGIAQEVVSALDFDPFEALDNSGGTGGQDSQQERQTGQTGAGQRPRDDSGRFTQEATTVKRATPAAPKAGEVEEQPLRSGRSLPKQQQSTAPPQDDGGEQQNSVAEMMQRLRETPAAFLSGIPGASQEAGSGPAAQPGGSQAPSPGWAYDYSRPWNEQRINMPPQLLEAIFHEDRGVAAEGLAVLVNTMYNSIMNDVHTRVAEVLYHAPQMTAQTADLKMAQNQLKQKFYGAWPELGDTVGMQTVHTLATNIANMYHSMGQNVDPMSDDFIGYVGEQAMKMLGRARRQGAQPRRQFQAGSSSRPNGGGDPFMEAIGMA